MAAGGGIVLIPWYATVFRGEYASWYQVPVVYEWYDRTARGALEPEAVAVTGE